MHHVSEGGKNGKLWIRFKIVCPMDDTSPTKEFWVCFCDSLKHSERSQSCASSWHYGGAIVRGNFSFTCPIHKDCHLALPVLVVETKCEEVIASLVKLTRAMRKTGGRGSLIRQSGHWPVNDVIDHVLMRVTGKFPGTELITIPKK